MSRSEPPARRQATRWVPAACGLLAGLLGCEWGRELHLPPPELPEGTQSAFVAFLEADLGPSVHVFSPDAVSWRILAAPETTSFGRIFVFPDGRSLTEYGLEEGPVRASGSASSSGLPTENALSWMPDEASSWTAVADGVPGPIASFRFDSRLPPSRCARLELSSTVDVSSASSPPSTPAVLAALDADRGVAFAQPGAPDRTAVVFTETSSFEYELGRSVHAGGTRSVFRRRDGRLVVGGFHGQVWTGRLGEPFTLTATVPADGRDSGVFVGFHETSDGRLYGLTRTRLWDFSAGRPRVVHSSPAYTEDAPSISSMRSGLAWSESDGALLFSFEDVGFVYRWTLEAGDEVEALSVGDSARSLHAVTGVGPMLTSLTRLQRWNAGLLRFEDFGPTSRDTSSLVGWNGRVFAIGERSWSQLSDDGAPCPQLSGRYPALSNSNAIVFGDHLARNGQSPLTVDVYQLSLP